MVSEKWLKKELKGFKESDKWKDDITRICKGFKYNNKQCKEVIMDGLWYNQEDFWRIHHKKFY